jgi:putative oxidoreductase
MNMTWMYREPRDDRTGFALLLLRLVTGAAFVLHGWPKIQKPFAWMGADGPVPSFVQALAAFAEFGGGIALILGLLTPIAAMGIAAVMIAAMTLVHLPKGHPFVGREHSYEIALVYLIIAVVILLLGPGALALDRFLFSRK